MNRDAVRSDSLLLITAAIWGAAFVAQRLGMEHVGPLTYNGVRFALGAAVLLPLALRPDPRPHRTDELPGPMARRPILLGGLIAGAALSIGATLQQVGLLWTTAGKAGFITGLYVIIVPLLGLFWGHRVTLGGWLGAASATVGLYLLSVTGGLSLAPGDAWVLVGAFFWAGHVLILGWLSPRMSAVKLAAAQFAVCAVLSLIGAAIMEQIRLADILAAAWAIIYGGAVSVGIAYTLQVVAQRHAPPFHAAIILSLESAFAALAGWLILGETLSPRAALGCALMLAGMLLAQLWPTGKRP